MIDKLTEREVTELIEYADGCEYSTDQLVREVERRIHAKVKEPTVYFITVFTDEHMEAMRTFSADKRPFAPYLEPAIVEGEETRYYIVRVRDDGKKLYYTSLGIGFWLNVAHYTFTKEDAEKELAYLERTAGKNGFYARHDSRTFGFFFNRADAIKAVGHNLGDMHEMKYSWLVIEPYEASGIHPFNDTDEDRTLWYRWKSGASPDEDGCWVKTERPPETKSTLCFAVG